MILPYESNGCAPENNDNTTAGQPTKVWRVRKLVEVVIDVPLQDAANCVAAGKCANELAAGLELKVTLGGVALPAKFK
jgi:hypothetical protein